jgi:holo-[acyl-carrier protein] synthase
MIKGIGVDIIEVDRIAKLAGNSPRFLEKVFTPTEIEYCSRKKFRYQHFAARFAAKEAFFKALGRPVSWKDVELVNLPSGKPTLEFKGAEHYPFSRAHVSVSHLADHAVAVVILEE